MRRTTAGLLLCLAFLVSVEFAGAREGQGKGRKAPALSKATGTPVSTLLNINNLAMWVRNDGWSARRPSDGNAGITFPRGTTETIFADGLIWGGFVQDGVSPALRVGGQTYNIGTVPGRIISPGVAEDRDATTNPTVRIFRIRRDWETAELRQDAAEVLAKAIGSVSEGDVQGLRDQYKQDWLEWPWEKGAPYYDRNNNGIYDPDPNAALPDTLTDEPGIADADQVIWFVINDLDIGATTALYGSPPIGIETQVTLWGYARTDPLGNAIFKQVRMIYKGTATTPPTATIDSMYFAQWSDPDLGDFGDDFVGSDEALSLGYVYNSTTIDNQYAQFDLAPPAAGYDFLQGPIVPGDPDDEAIFGLKIRKGFKNLPLTAFVAFSASGGISDPEFDYSGTLGWYNLLRGFKPLPADVDNPVPFFDPAGIEQRITLTGDPVTGEGWIDTGPADRRFVIASGPFTMAVGDTQEVVIGHLAGLGADRLSSISVLKFNDVSVQAAYDNLFELPKAPAPPVLKIDELDQELVLEWGFDAAAFQLVEGQDEKGYTFEGYNVYQVPSVAATFDQAIKLATFDVVNEVTTILDNVFDEASGQILTKPVQIGKNSGISRFMSVTEDRIRGRSLVNGQTYYFAVTAYNNNSSPDVAIHSLETPLSVLSAVPHSPAPGVRLASAFGDTVQSTHAAGTSDGSVTVLVVDPSATTGHDYSVTFDTLGGGTVWNLTDVTTGTVLLSNQTNQSGDEDYLVVDGLHVKTSGPPLVGQDWDYASADPPNLSPVAVAEQGYTGGRWLTGGSHGGELLFGGVFLEPNFWGATTLSGADYTVVEVHFRPMQSYTDLNGDGMFTIGEPYVVEAGPNDQSAFMYQTFAGSAYEGFFPMPFTAWDVTDPANPRQLNMVHRDRDADFQWQLHNEADPPDPLLPNNGDQRFPYTWILSTSYDPTGTMYGDGTGGSLDFFAAPGGAVYDAMWVLWLDDRHNGGQLAEESILTLTPPFINTSADVFTFTAPAAAIPDDDLAKQDVEQINVFPNPYLGLNRAELDRFSRFVTFNHLPSRATIRIFNLAGVMVRTIEKDDASTQFTQWDLENENGLPVASGIYIAHVDLPDLGAEKTLKLIIILEQQVLENF